MTRVNSMAIPTADLRPRLDLPMIKRSSQRWFQARQRGYPRAPAPTQKRAVDSLAALRLIRHREPQWTHQRPS
jgi:hypothetical protein